jgi:hypothetical protein
MNEKSLEALLQISDTISAKETYKLKFQSEASDFTITFANPINLNQNRKYVFGLKRFSVYNTLFNVNKENNRMTYSLDQGRTWKDIYIPQGAYESKGLNKRIQSLITDAPSGSFTIEADEETSQAILKINNPVYRIDFTKPNSINTLLGFKPKIYQGSKDVSDDIIKITMTNDIDIYCSLITSNSYVNGKNESILYSVSAYSVQVGAKIIVSEINPLFLPINTSVIDTIRFQIMDDNKKLINFNGETLVIDCVLTQI